jgi:Uma2 family endonuclease
MSQPEMHPMTAAEFLSWETEQPERYEFIDGQAFAMAGASEAHGTIVFNIPMLLGPALRGGPCRGFVTDMKLAIPPDDRRIYYPDAFVTCDERDRRDRQVKRHPKLIVEVLSPKSEADDRGEKFSDYRTIETLEEYILVDSRRQHVEVYRRTDRGTWELVEDVTSGAFVIASLGVSISLVDLYADVEFEPARRVVRPTN